MASTSLTRTISSTSNRQTLTVSTWLKRSELDSANDFRILTAKSGSDQNWFSFDQDYLTVGHYNGSSYQYRNITSRLFRDVSAWYHIVIAIDTTQATASNRVKIYVNGVEETSFSTEVQPSLNQNTVWNTSGYTNYIGEAGSSNNYFDGQMTHFHFIDGTAYDASAFGETDATTGQWKINTSPSVTYGTNGFFILKDGNSVTDQSGNSNDFTVGGGTLTNTEDCPSNVFATMNPLVRYTANPTFTNGNLSFSGGGGADFAGALGTLAMTEGKWFWECKISATVTNTSVGVQQVGLNLNTSEPQNITGGTTCFSNNDGGEMKTDGIATTADYGTFSDSDIMGVAVNMDDKQISIYKNGSAIISNFALSSSSTEVLPFFAMYSSGAIVNFGNGYFGTTAVASAGTNASGNGIFEYDVPTGYTALSTKGLNL